MSAPDRKRRETLHIARPSIDAPADVPRIEGETDWHYMARCASIRALGVSWWGHPAYGNPARHSLNPEVYQAARQPYLAEIRERAAADRARNPLAVMQQQLREAMGAKA